MADRDLHDLLQGATNHGVIDPDSRAITVAMRRQPGPEPAQDVCAPLPRRADQAERVGG